MKRSVLILVTFFLFDSAYSQTHEIDSLKQRLQKERTDTGRVLILSELAFRYHGSTPDTAMTYAVQALDIAVRINYKKGEAISLNRIGNVYSVLGDHSKALEVWLKALKINEQIGNLDGQRSNMNNIGLVFKDYQGDNRKALSYFLKSRKMAEDMKNESAIMVVDANLAETYKNLKIFDSAKIYAQESLNKVDKLKSSRGGTVLLVFGDIYFAEAKYPLALEYSRMSFPELIKDRSYQTLSRGFLLTAKIFEKQGQKDSCLFYAKRSVSLAKEKGFLLEIRDAAKFLSYQYRDHNPYSAFFTRTFQQQ